MLLVAAPLHAKGEEDLPVEFTMPETVIDLPKAGSTDASLGADRVDEAEVAARRSVTGDASDLLRGVPGVTLNGAGGVSSLPAIHGLSDDRLRIQVDGMDLLPACPNHMNSTLSYADPSRVETVTVFSGVTPVSVGGDSIGGSIQVRSARPRFATPDAPLLGSAEAGSFWRSNGNGVGYTLGVTGALQWVNVTFRQSSAWSDDVVAGGAFKPAAPGTEGGPVIPGDVIGSSQFSNTVRRSLGVAFRLGVHLLQLEASQQGVTFEGFPNQRMDMTWNDNWLYTLRYSGAFTWGDLEARASYQTTRHEMNMGPDRYSYGTGMPMNTEAWTGGASVQANVLLSARHTLRTGAESLYQVLYDFWPPVGGVMGPNTFWNVDFGQRLRGDVFGEWEARWDDAWLTLVGARLDGVMTDAGPVQGYDDSLPAWGLDAAAFNASPRRHVDVNWDLSALARFTPDATQTYEGGYARKSRSPGLYQRYPWSTNAMAALMNNLVGDGNGYVGLLDLRPEVAHTVSVTGDWHDAARERWSARVTAWYTRVQDFVNARRCDFGQCSPDNVGAKDAFVILQFANHEARLYGVDVSGRMVLAEGPDWGSLSGTVGLGWTRGDDLTTGDGLYGIMPASGTLSVAYKLSTWITTAELQAVAAKTHLSEVRNEIPTGAYFLLALRSSWEWKFLRLDAAVENLLDRLYANPMGGAYVGQGPSMSTSSIPWGVAVPGAGRSFQLAVNLRF